MCDLSSCAAKHPLHELQRSLQEQEEFRTACLSAITKLQQAIRSKAASLGHSTAVTPTLNSADVVHSMTCAELAAYVASLRQQKSKLHEMVSASAARSTTSSFDFGSDGRDSSSGARRAEALRPPAVPSSATLAAMSAYAEAMLGYHTARLAACQVHVAIGHSPWLRWLSGLNMSDRMCASPCR
jgi:hypothetical protein